MFWCREKRRDDLGQGSSVHVAMVMAVPMTLEGGREVKGHRLRRMVQLSPWRPRHLAAAKSYVHRKKEGGGGGGGGSEDPSAFILKEEEEENKSVSWRVIYRHEVESNWMWFLSSETKNIENTSLHPYSIWDLLRRTERKRTGQTDTPTLLPSKE